MARNIRSGESYVALMRLWSASGQQAATLTATPLMKSTAPTEIVRPTPATRTRLRQSFGNLRRFIMRVAVAGATGHIGALTAAALERSGHDVVRISRSLGVDLLTLTR